MKRHFSFKPNIINKISWAEYLREDVVCLNLVGIKHNLGFTAYDHTG